MEYTEEGPDLLENLEMLFATMDRFNGDVDENEEETPLSPGMPGGFWMIQFERLSPSIGDIAIIVYRADNTDVAHYAIFNELTATCERMSAEQLVTDMVPEDLPFDQKVRALNDVVLISSELIKLVNP